MSDSTFPIRIGEYRIQRKIGAGSFGVTFLAENIYTGKEVALKIEHSRTKHQQLGFEYRLYKTIEEGKGVPLVHDYVKYDNFNVLVMELLGPSLESLFNRCGRVFSFKTVLMLTDQILLRLEYLHSKCYIHRDIKPDNFLMGLGNQNKLLFLIDFGLAAKYCHSRTHKHVEEKATRNFLGTPRYASINCHLGKEQSRRDDLEACGYMLVYFLLSKLPWQGLKSSSRKQRCEKIAEIKQSTPLEVLCKGLPSEFGAYINYCRLLTFDEDPNYECMRLAFQLLSKRLEFINDGIYSWDTEENSLTPKSIDDSEDPNKTDDNHANSKDKL